MNDRSSGNIKNNNHDGDTCGNETPAVVNPYALSEAQDVVGEMFEVMEPPKNNFNMYQDRPVSTGEIKPRGLVHRDGNWHRSVHTWIVDIVNKRVVLQRRSPTKDTFPNRWDISAAGHIEAPAVTGTDVDAANRNDDTTSNNNSNNNQIQSDTDLSSSRSTAIRELAEELGITATMDELVFAFTCPAEQANWGGCNCYEDVFFLLRDSNNCSFAIGQAEVLDVKWMDVIELEQVMNCDDSNDQYVPRVHSYRIAFFQFLNELCS